MIKSKFKSGAASFYIVAFSTLILVIIAASFASAIIAEITRTTNADLAQSAYDAALAGVEDAKAAFINYQNCIAAGKTADYNPNNPLVTCGDIIYWMEEAPDCDMVGHILGRIPKGEHGEVQITETIDATTNNNMQQAYTCVIISDPNDYKADINSKNPYRIIKIKLEKDNPNEDVASKVDHVRISWHKYGEKSKNNSEMSSFVYNNVKNGKVAFQSIGQSGPGIAVPPTIAVQLIQTAKDFSLADLNGKTMNGKTDRGTVYLVPTNSVDMAKNNRGSDIQSDWTFIGTYDETANDDKGDNIITGSQFASTNDHGKDYPFAVYCPEDSANTYACSVKIQLPDPVGTSGRSDETFVFVVSLPYGQPDTEFSLQLFYKGDEDSSGSITLDDEGNEEDDPLAKLDKMQVLIDSTGRANDLYRRLEIRMDPGESAFGFPLYAVQVDDSFEKTLTVTKETGDYSGYNNW